MLPDQPIYQRHQVLSRSAEEPNAAAGPPSQSSLKLVESAEIQICLTGVFGVITNFPAGCFEQTLALRPVPPPRSRIPISSSLIKCCISELRAFRPACGTSFRLPWPQSSNSRRRTSAPGNSGLNRSYRKTMRLSSAFIRNLFAFYRCNCASFTAGCHTTHEPSPRERNRMRVLSVFVGILALAQSAFALSPNSPFPRANWSARSSSTSSTTTRATATGVTGSSTTPPKKPALRSRSKPPEDPSPASP